MIKQFSVPELGENIDSGQVVKVLVEAGATVAAGAPVVELETGKAVLEIPAEEGGVVEQVLVAEGDTVPVGAPLLSMRVGDAAPAPAAPQAAAKAAAAPQPEAKPAAVPEAKPAAVAPPPVPSPEPVQPPAPTAAPVAHPAPPPAGTPASPARHVPAAPSVRRFAREIGVAIDTVTGSGRHGRVSIEDVKRHARERAAAGGGAPGPALPPLPDFGKWGPIRRERMSGIRFATAEQVSRCWNTIPRVTHFDRADITQLEQLRKRYADRASAKGGKLTMAVMVVKVVAAALKVFPKFNASVDMVKREVVFKDFVNIGIAVATDRGLLVPVLRDVEQKNMVRLAVEISEIAAKCREGKVTPADLEGGTFTVTNLGSIGGSYFTPIVNYPEVAILGMGRAMDELVLRDGKPETRVMLPLSLSYDHRLIDGADAARFVRWIAEAIEEPLLLSLEG